MRKCARVALVATAVVAVTGAAAEAASIVKPSGNAKAIAFAQSAQSAYRKVPNASYTRRGFTAIRSTIAPVSTARWSFGTGRVPAGWTAATEHVVVGLRQGKVNWVTDDFIPGSCPASSGCQASPLSILVTTSGAFWRFDSSDTQLGCYKRLGGKTSFTAGAEWLAVTGTYRPLVHRGASVLSGYTYPWTKHQTASVTDTVSSHSKLLSSERISVPEAGTAHPAFTVTSTYANLTTAPTEPALSVCS
jgi:hypothetical protein